MRFLIISCLLTIAFARPEGYLYNSLLPLKQHPDITNGPPQFSPPCAHLIQAQSMGRIVNHGNNHHHEQGLEGAASKINVQSQAFQGNNYNTFGASTNFEVQPNNGYIANGNLPFNTHPASVPVRNSYYTDDSHHLTHQSSETAGYNYQGVNTNVLPQVQTTNYPLQSGSNFNTLDTSHISSISSSSISTSNSLNGHLGEVIRETFKNAPLDPTFEKHIYVHVPPDELEEKHNIQQIPVAPPRKHYKIIFIKAPATNNVNYGQLATVKQPEEKTLIYVLVKKPDEPSLEEIQQLHQLSTKSHKPEVYFINYKTRHEFGTEHQQPYNKPVLPNISAENKNPLEQVNGIEIAPPQNHLPESQHREHELYGVPLN